jgi:hypothetical protein
VAEFLANVSSIIFPLPPLFIYFLSVPISLYCHGLDNEQDITIIISGSAICIVWL